MMNKRITLALALQLAAAPLWAQPTDAQKAKVNALWQAAFDSWGPLITCTATDGGSIKVLHGAWLGARNDGLKAMAAAGWAKAELDTLRAQTEPEQLRLPPDTSFAEVISYCTRNKDWFDRLNSIDVMKIGVEVEKALAGGATP